MASPSPGRKRLQAHCREHAWLYLILIGAAALRFAHLRRLGFRFCDEGYHLLHAVFLLMDPEQPFLYFKHGLQLLIAGGVSVFGLDQTGSLRWSATCGLVTVLLIYRLLVRFQPRRLALLSTLALAGNSYLLFYQRSNMSDGYALLVFAAALVLLTGAAVELQLWPAPPARATARAGRWPLLRLFAAGLLVGFAFTVRIPTAVIIGGCFGAILTAAMLRGQWRCCRRLLVSAPALLVFAAVGYIIIMYALRDVVLWDSSREWYGKNFVLLDQSPVSWRPYPLLHLFWFCSLPFLLLALLGLGRHLRSPLRCGSFNLWLVICLLGLLAMQLRAALPWPRAHLYLVFFLCPLWAAGVDSAAHWTGRRCRRFRRGYLLTVAVISLLTVAAELRLARPLLTRSGGYNQVMAFLLADGIGDRLVTTHAWPIYRAEHRHQTIVVYEPLREIVRGDDGDLQRWLAFLVEVQRERQATHLVLDHYLVYFTSPEQLLFLARFCAAYPPDLLAPAQFSSDRQTCLDAFREYRPTTIFSRYHLVYRLDRFVADPTPRPLPQTSDSEDLARLVTGAARAPLR